MAKKIYNIGPWCLTYLLTPSLYLRYNLDARSTQHQNIFWNGPAYRMCLFNYLTVVSNTAV